jgi:hypothetical protein
MAGGFQLVEIREMCSVRGNVIDISAKSVERNGLGGRTLRQKEAGQDGRKTGKA